MTTLTFSLFKVLKKHLSEIAAEEITPVIEQMLKANAAEREEQVVRSAVHAVDREIDLSVDRKIEKEHKYLATKGDVTAVSVELKESIMKLREEMVSLREDIQKQIRSSNAVGLAGFAVIISILLYIVSRLP